MEERMIKAAGRNGTVTFDGAVIFIEKTAGITGFMNQGIQGNRWIVARSITAVEFREPSKRAAGFIAFDFPGKNPHRGGVFDAATDENAMVFGDDSADAFRALRNEIVTYVAAVSRALDATYQTAYEVPAA